MSGRFASIVLSKFTLRRAVFISMSYLGWIRKFLSVYDIRIHKCRKKIRSSLSGRTWTETPENVIIILQIRLGITLFLMLEWANGIVLSKYRHIVAFLLHVVSRLTDPKRPGHYNMAINKDSISISKYVITFLFVLWLGKIILEMITLLFRGRRWIPVHAGREWKTIFGVSNHLCRTPALIPNNWWGDK